MDHVPSLPKSHRGNTELLVWVDHQAYERCIYRQYGASEVVRHDREPAFMSEVFRAFNRLIGQRSKATLAYRPQANGTTERMVQTVMRAVKLYVADPAQRDWDDYAERLVFALNLSFDRTRQETPVLERPEPHLAKLEIDGTGYKFFPLVHVSRLKLKRTFHERPQVDLEVASGDRFDFDEALLPEDSFEPDNEAGEYEVEAIIDHREKRSARQGRPLKEYLVRWKGYDDPTWVAEADLRAPSLLDEYEQACSARARFAAMEVEEE
ncbi:hypothetical protein P43SY_011736 [Pythium insidiosum]|uniref:Reverse transcriptase n=1 Tax=Pythium insidiosum TaxID=114742 RepID=A0AAD5L651_PYTIN|nr:hypothetical protein P43SY_011736 [Pythium insidiosum]